MKRYYRPVRTRCIDRMIWFAVGDKLEIEALLRKIPSIGGDRARGYGRVASWLVDDFPYDYSLTADNGGPVLMRRVPSVFAELNPGLRGARTTFGACQPPYYHPDRQMEILEPV
jgi:hypothetical protein